METATFIGLGGIGFLGLYFTSLLAVGWLGHRAKQQNTLTDFYLACHSMGVVTLFLTLYATQYSGNTLVGFAAKAYRQGFTFLVSITFMMGIIGVYWLFAPRLHRLSREKTYITPGDFITDRYGSTVLTTLLNIIFIVTLASYILANLKAIGHTIDVISGGLISFSTAIMSLALIMVIYESLGGMRAVAWTDMIQGLILLIGSLIIFFAIDSAYGGIGHMLEQVRATRPAFWAPPDTQQKLSWLSTLILVSFGAALYPHAIQRIYAARHAKILQRAFQLMLLMPLVTTLLILLIGIAGTARFPNLDRVGSEQITLLLLTDLANTIPSLQIVLTIFVAAVIAAIMSTIDSALLAISSIFTQDIYRPLRSQASQAHLTQTGKVFSWLLMGAMTFLARHLPQTIWKLTVLKLELLIQAAPTILLGVHKRRPPPTALILGVLVGISVTIILKFAPTLGLDLPSKPLGIHAGIWGLLSNSLVIILITLIPKRFAGSRLQSAP
jgi:solute:Na+ symporter, SSS family